MSDRQATIESDAREIVPPEHAAGRVPQAVAVGDALPENSPIDAANNDRTADHPEVSVIEDKPERRAEDLATTATGTARGTTIDEAIGKSAKDTVVVLKTRAELERDELRQFAWETTTGGGDVAANPDATSSDRRDRKLAFSVADVATRQRDLEEREIVEVYARKRGSFAVYLVHGGDVWIQFADDQQEGDRQRARVSKVCQLRWELNQLAKGWRREEHYYRELAAGLQLALVEDPANAEQKLTRALASLKAEREVAGRIDYMLFAAASAAFLMLLLSVMGGVHPFATAAENVWLAGKAGLTGAFFSVAIAIRGRAVALDTDKGSNAMEGALRLSIGIIAGGFLLLALGSGWLGRLVAGDITVTGQIGNWQSVAVLGFAAGFLERLVPSLLDKGKTPPAG